MASQKLKLTRDQLAAFLGKDSEAIKQFERLFSTTDELSTSVQDELTNAAVNAEARAQQAIDSLNMLSDVLESLALQPAEVQPAVVQDLTPPVQVLQAVEDLTPPVQPDHRKRFGTFYDTTTQTAAAINTGYAVNIGNTDLSSGVYIASGNRITVDTEGVYDFQFSMQLNKITGGKGTFYLWTRVNGVDSSESATRLALQGNGAEAVAAWNFVYKLKAGDYLQLMWSVDDTSVEIVRFAASAPVPGIPSVIVTVTNNIG